MGPQRPLLSVIVPVFNEERTVRILLRKLLAGPYPYPEKELIVVDDGSTDATARVLQEFGDVAGVILLHHEHNRGKSSAIRTALLQARGEVTIIQDADLEYDSQEIPRLVEIIHRREAEVVYGSRYLAPEVALPWTRFRLAVMLLNGLVRLLYGQRVTDEATCYKAFRTSLLRDMDLQAERFEFCPEVTAKACRMGRQIVEVPISYQPRSNADGKKIRWADGFEAAWTLLRWRFQRFATPNSPKGQLCYGQRNPGNTGINGSGVAPPAPVQSQVRRQASDRRPRSFRASLASGRAASNLGRGDSIGP